MTYNEAVQACQKDGAQIAKVGQMYAAWKLLGYDRCDSGWLADGSVRYPISRPRRRCSPTEAAVRFSGFPDKKHKLYGVYCFKGYNWEMLKWSLIQKGIVVEEFAWVKLWPFSNTVLRT